MGIVSMTIPNASIKQPPTRYIKMMIPIMACLGSGKAATQSAKSKGSRVTAMKCPKITAPVTMIITIQLICVVPIRDWRNPSQVSCFLSKAITRVKKAPMAPASVGVKMPKKILP